MSPRAEDTAGANEDSALSGSALMQEARRGGGWQPSHGPIGRADGGAIVHGKSDIIHGNTRCRYIFHGSWYIIYSLGLAFLSCLLRLYPLKFAPRPLPQNQD